MDYCYSTVYGKCEKFHVVYLLPGGVGSVVISAGFSFSLLLSRFLADGVRDRDLLPLGDFSRGDLLRPPLGERGDLDLGLSDLPVPGRSSWMGVWLPSLGAFSGDSGLSTGNCRDKTFHNATCVLNKTVGLGILGLKHNIYVVFFLTLGISYL